MQVDLNGRLFRVIGTGGVVPDAIAAALASNGAQRTEGRGDLLIVCRKLLPDDLPDDGYSTMQAAIEQGGAMATGSGGRIVFVLSALAGLPMRRHLDYSAGMAAAVASMRGLAMELAPNILVNAVGAGMIEDAGGELLAGDAKMLSHVALGRPGSLADLAHAVLFLCDPLNSYTTGQLLVVDGGWSVGYGRNF